MHVSDLTVVQPPPLQATAVNNVTSSHLRIPMPNAANFQSYFLWKRLMPLLRSVNARDVYYCAIPSTSNSITIGTVLPPSVLRFPSLINHQGCTPNQC
jgi:hypothetical protein